MQNQINNNNGRKGKIKISLACELIRVICETIAQHFSIGLPRKISTLTLEVFRNVPVTLLENDTGSSAISVIIIII